jgi:glucosamine-phosphate N-acetyltransferase
MDVKKMNIRSLAKSKSDYTSYNLLLKQLTEQHIQYSYDEYCDIYDDIQGLQYIYVLELADGTIIGCIKIIIERKFYNIKSYVGHVEDVVIDNDYRGNGYGQLLVEHVTKIWAQKCYKINLTCSDKNVGFYEKCTYRNSGTCMSFRSKI